MKRYIFVLLTSLLINVHGVMAASAPDFKTITNIAQRKQAFFNYLIPIVNKANDQLLKTRKLIENFEKSYKNKDLTHADLAQLERISEHYKVKPFDPAVPANWQLLLKRVDIVPTSLVLAQAATESAWGTSRFARQANNYFGQWCYSESCGLVPKQRAVGAHHQVKVFSSPLASVRSYLYNLNTNPRYQTLRTLRAKARSQALTLSGLYLADGLLYYSERRQVYIDSIKQIIGTNRLARYDDVKNIA